MVAAVEAVASEAVAVPVVLAVLAASLAFSFLVLAAFCDVVVAVAHAEVVAVVEVVDHNLRRCPYQLHSLLLTAKS